MDFELWRKRRKELNLTLDDLAEKSGISRRTIAGIFSGDPRYSSPTLNTINAIERALEIDGFTPEEKALGYSTTTRMEVTEDERLLILDYRDLGKKKGAPFQELVREHLNKLLSV